MQLTLADVERLHRTSFRMRIDVAERIAEGYVAGIISGHARDVAIDIFRFLVKDAEMRVRKALAYSLQHAADLPHDIAIALAWDEEEVARPILELSPILEDEDLLDLIESAEEIEKLCAIARRKNVSEPISHALVQTQEPDAITFLLKNESATLHEESILHVIEYMASQESVIDLLVDRGNLPPACVEKLFMAVSGQMKERLISKHQLSPHMANDAIRYAREWATLELSPLQNDRQICSLIEHLHSEHRLTSALVVRALCAGDLTFFEAAMARFAAIPLENAKTLIRDAGLLGFSALYRMTPLPPNYYNAIKTLLEVILELKTHHGKTDMETMSKQVIAHITAHGYDTSVEYMPILLTIMRGNASEFPYIH